MRLKCYKTRTLQTDKCYLAGSLIFVLQNKKIGMPGIIMIPASLDL